MSTARMSIRASLSENTARVLPEMFKHRLLQVAEETLDSMQAIWKEAGYEEVECQRLLGDFLNKLKNTCSTELKAEEQILEHAKAEVQSKCEEYSSYCEQLGRPCNMQHVETMNYTDRLTELERLIGLISGEVSERQDLLDAELSSINSLVAVLGEQAPDDNAFDGPAGTPFLSDVRLNLMRQYVANLEALKTDRTNEVTELAQECGKHMADLMYAEEGFKTMDDSEMYFSLDKQVDAFSRSGVFNLGITTHDISTLSTRLQSLVEEKERRRIELGKIGADIARLWTLLRVPSTERDKFSSSFKMNLSMETLSKGVDELQRLQEIRAQSLGKVIAAIREDIAVLWQEAGIETEETRMKEFPMYFQDVGDMEDTAVDMHEEYFNALRVRVEELRPLLQKVARRETVVQERIDLEHLQMNPERLTARGPNAREERKKEEYMSNRVKNLDKITKELLTHISAWEESNGPFLYGGDRYCDRVVLQDEHYLEIRDSLRNARKKKDGKDVTIAPSSKTMGAASKRASVHMNSTVKATPAKHHAPPAPSTQPHARTVMPPVPETYTDNCENVEPDGCSNASSRESEGTIKTSLTQIKERPLSTDSHTVVRVPLM